MVGSVTTGVVATGVSTTGVSTTGVVAKDVDSTMLTTGATALAAVLAIKSTAADVDATGSFAVEIPDETGS